jgi:hypothetical protein
MTEVIDNLGSVVLTVYRHDVRQRKIDPAKDQVREEFVPWFSSD